VLTGSSDGTVICWNLVNGSIKRKFIGPPNSVVSAMQVIRFIVPFKCRLHATSLNCLRNTVTLMLENHFSQRVVNVWNSLPPKIVDSSSLRSFKRTVKTCRLLFISYTFLVFTPVLLCLLLMSLLMLEHVCVHGRLLVL